MTHMQWVVDYESYYTNISFFKKFFFRIFKHDFRDFFEIFFGGHIYMNRLVSTSSSALNSQKSKITSKKKLILRLNMALWILLSTFPIEGLHEGSILAQWDSGLHLRLDTNLGLFRRNSKFGIVNREQLTEGVFSNHGWCQCIAILLCDSFLNRI